jgi:hypothetical protein
MVIERRRSSQHTFQGYYIISPFDTVRIRENRGPRTDEISWLIDFHVVKENGKFLPAEKVLWKYYGCLREKGSAS